MARRSKVDFAGRPQSIRGMAWIVALAIVAVAGILGWSYWDGLTSNSEEPDAADPIYQPREDIDASGFAAIRPFVPPWKPDAELTEIRDSFEGAAMGGVAAIDRQLASSVLPQDERLLSMINKALLFNYEGQPDKAYDVLAQTRSFVESDPAIAPQILYSLIYLEGIAALRRGENENCILCRGESSCILPDRAGRRPHQPRRLAAGDPPLHRVPRAVPRRPRGPLAAQRGPHDAGRTPAEGRSPVPDLARSLRQVRSSTSASSATSATWSGSTASTRPAARSWTISTTTACSTSPSPRSIPTSSMALLPQQGRRHLRGPHAKRPGSTGQLGGLNCVQTDYNNDGYDGHFRRRAAPGSSSCRSASRLLRNNGDGTFTDVTRAGGAASAPVNSIAARLGRLRQRRLARRVRRAASSSPTGCITTAATAPSRRSPPRPAWQGARAVCLQGRGLDRLRQRRLSRPVRQQPALGTPSCFTTTATARSPTSPRRMGIDGPAVGLLVLGLGLRQRRLARHLRHLLRPNARGRGQGHASASRTAAHRTGSSATVNGKGFEDVTKEAGLDMVFAHHGEQLRRLRQRRLPRFVPGHRRPEPRHVCPQPHVQERRRPAFRRDHRLVGHGHICRRGTAWPAATGTATATSISSSRWAAPSTATSTTTSCSRTPARGTTG